MIGQTEVFRLAQRFGVGERVIEKDYVLSWILVAIAESGLRGHVAFKGGTALKRAYFPDYRFSEDLDFTLPRDLAHDELVGFVSGLLPSLLRRVNLRVDLVRADLTPHRSTDVEVAYVGPLQAMARPRRLKMDFTRGELLVNAPIRRELKAPYSDYPKAVTLATYTINQILAEKLCALMGRTEPRDLYDVWWLLESGRIELVAFVDDFVRKAEHKGHDPGRLYKALGQKQPRLERLWQARLSRQAQELPDFEEVMRTVRRHVRQLQLG
jgi:predicted nucleotidyltransferase component of viral defense system